MMLFNRQYEQRAAAQQWYLLDDSHIQNVTNAYITHGYIGEEGRERNRLTSWVKRPHETVDWQIQIAEVLQEKLFL